MAQGDRAKSVIIMMMRILNIASVFFLRR